MLTKTLEDIKEKNCIIEVFGLGYVGLPLCHKLTNSGFKVLGIDKDIEKINKLKNLESPNSEIDLSELKNAIEKKYLDFSNQSLKTEKPRVGIICVPTPIPNSSITSNIFVKEAVKNFLESSKIGDVIIIESSIEIGTTEIIQEIIEERYVVGKEIGLIFCPERIDPLNKEWRMENIPRIVYSSDDISFSISKEIYHHVNSGKLFRVKTAKTAEMIKSYENAFRLINISLVNELAMLCDQLDVDIHDVIKAAATKPFGFMPFHPSAGAGGHCIPKDPVFLLLSAKKFKMDFSIIDNAININKKIPQYIANSITDILEKEKLERSIIISGLSYKPNIADMRDSPGFKIVNALSEKKFKISVYDPYIKNDISETTLKENNVTGEFSLLNNLDSSTIKDYNCLCLVQDHANTLSRIIEIFDKSEIPIIYDCKGVIKNKENSKTILKTFGANTNIFSQ